jgi:DNA-binding transcriptional ArsR family regulator
MLVIRICGAAAALLLFFSCMSSPRQPDWIERYPSDDRYYIGIGSSNDPVQSVAAAKARQDALANLASSISTSIITETETRISESTENNNVQSVQRRIQEKVYQTLEGAEVVDSFYSMRQGYWVYMRISRNQLERQKRELAKRLEELLLPVYTEEDLSAAASLSLLHKGHELLMDSPYFTSLSGELGKTRGNLLDLVEKKTAETLASISISVQPDSLEGRAGERVGAIVSIQGKLPAGLLPISVSLDEEILKEGDTGDDGRYAFQIDLAGIPLGHRTLSIDIQLDALGIEQKDYYLNMPSISAELPVHVLPLPLDFIMEYDERITLEGIPEMASGLFFASELPFSLAEENDGSEYSLRCRLIVEDFPRYRDNSLEISQARLIIQVEFQGRILYSYQSPAMKDGGLTISQAHERTIKKLFRKLEDEQEYLPGLIEALPIRTSR